MDGNGMVSRYPWGLDHLVGKGSSNGDVNGEHFGAQAWIYGPHG